MADALRGPAFNQHLQEVGDAIRRQYPLLEICQNDIVKGRGRDMVAFAGPSCPSAGNRAGVVEI